MSIDRLNLQNCSSCDLSIRVYTSDVLQMEEVDIGLCEETASETSPDFDEVSQDPPT